MASEALYGPLVGKNRGSEPADTAVATNGTGLFGMTVTLEVALLVRSSFILHCAAQSPVVCGVTNI